MTQDSQTFLDQMLALHPVEIDLTLDRVWRLLDRLGDPHQKLPPVIHIAGTNGKGSTQAMIRAGLEAAGKRVHAYTSPHLATFHERITIAGEMISEAELCDVLARCLEANADDEITFFEITTVAALLAMSEAAADYTLLEVGLGGRLDATNVVATPAACVITPIDLDHQEFLGDTLEEIAGEKAGIIKRDVPCIVGPQHEGALDVIEHKAARVRAPLIAHGQTWHVTTEAERLVFQDDTGLLDLPMPSLRGPHQIMNAGAAIATLRRLGFQESTAEGAMTGAKWPARMERLTAGALADAASPCELWLDGGHNPAAGFALTETLRTLPKRPTHMICGMRNTKDYREFLRAISPVTDSLTAVAIPDEPQSLSASELASGAEQTGLVAKTAKTVFDAVQAIKLQEQQARIVICGSLYLAGHIKRLNI